jgi:tRNA (guanosine-2'-O-)-methyltransferase
LSAVKSRRRVRRTSGHGCWDHLIVAPLWVAYGANLGTLLRIHWVDRGQQYWVEAQQATGTRIVAVELAEGAIPLPRREPARERTVVLLGHERHGVPEKVVDLADTCVEIPLARPWRAASSSTASPGSRESGRLRP